VLLILDPRLDPGGIGYHIDLVHQEFTNGASLASLSLLIPKILPFFTQQDRITDVPNAICPQIFQEH